MYRVTKVVGDKLSIQGRNGCYIGPESRVCPQPLLSSVQYSGPTIGNMSLTGMFLNDVHGGVQVVVRLSERGHGVHLMEAHLLQCGDIPFRKENLMYTDMW